MIALRRGFTIAVNDLELMIREPGSVIIIVVMPLVVMAFVKPTYAAVLKQHGHPFANGAEQAVPGMALMFAFFMVSFAGLAFFRDHIWNTWNRIRALPVRRSEVMLGKLCPAFAFICVQQLVLFVSGRFLFALHIRGSIAALIAVDLAFVVWLVAFILATVAYCSTFQQVLAVSNLGAIVFAGVGGVLTPIASLPGWARTIAPVTPDYWAMKGFNRVILDGRSLSAVSGSVAVLLGSAVVLTVVAAARFRFDTPKRGVLPGL